MVFEIEHALDAVDIHRQPLDAIGQLGRDRVAFDAADLLEIGELADLHAIDPDLPAEAPGAQGRAFPIILDKADVVPGGVDADRGEAREIKLLAVCRGRLQDHLKLVMQLQPVRVVAIAAICRPARGLDISGAPGLGAERLQRRRRMKRARADLDIVGLEDHAALPRPIALQLEDQRLKAQFPHLVPDTLSAAADNRAGRSRARGRRHRPRKPRRR